MFEGSGAAAWWGLPWSFCLLGPGVPGPVKSQAGSEAAGQEPVVSIINARGSSASMFRLLTLPAVCKAQRESVQTHQDCVCVRFL